MVGIYFSGTGGTRYCISKFMKEIGGGEAFSIEDKNCISQVKNHNSIIFAYPVYFSSLPTLVRDFICNNSSVWQGKNIYVIATMGMFSGDGSGYPARMFKKYGAKIIGGLHLTLPDSISDEKAFAKKPEENIKLLNLAEKKLKSAAKRYADGTPTKEGIGFGSHMLGLLGQRLWFGSKTKQYSNKLKVSSSCTVCKKCVTVCPTSNISIKSNRATPKNHCTMCYRCVNLCPTQAITLLGKTVYKQYHVTDKFIQTFLKDNI